MKKILLVSMMALGLGTVAMAKSENHGNHMRGNRMGSHNRCSENSNEQLEIRKAIKDNPKFDQWQIELQEIKVKLMKEMAKDTPNFTEIEKINREKAVVQAKMRTERMRIKYKFDQQIEENKNN